MGTVEPTSNGLGDKKDAQVPMTRQQRRQVEIATEKAMRQFNALCERFSDFIYNTDNLTDEMVKAKQNELCAKWSLYSSEHRLNKDSKLAMKDYCEKLYGLYKAELRGEAGEQDSLGKVITE